MHAARMPGTAVAQLSRIAVDPKNTSMAESHRPGLQDETPAPGGRGCWSEVGRPMPKVNRTLRTLGARPQPAASIYPPIAASVPATAPTFAVSTACLTTWQQNSSSSGSS